MAAKTVFMSESDRREDF